MVSWSKVGSAFIEIKAEDVFKDGIRDLAKQITLAQIRDMARLNIHAADVFYEELYTLAKEANRDGVAYLVSCSDAHILRLIAQAAPQHASILNENPRYAAQLASEIRGIVRLALR